MGRASNVPKAPWEPLQIVEGLRAGSAAAAVALYGAIQPSISATLTQVLGRADRDHDDLCQAALIRVVDSVVQGRFEGRCSLRTWANLIALRVALDELRRRRRERSVIEVDAAEEKAQVPSPASDNPERTLSERQQLVELRAALAQLGPARARAVALFDILGHDLKEVARIMNVSVASAQSRVVRGRRELRRILRASQVREQRIFDRGGLGAAGAR